VPGPIGIPPLGNMATLASTGALAMVTMRFRLLGRELPANRGLLAVGLALVGLVSYLALFRWLGTRGATLALRTVTMGFALFAAAREVMFSAAIRRERMQQLATLGRFSQQLAHDLKNPLTALDGSLQFLKKERTRGRSLADHEDYLDLMADQVTRL